MKKRLFGVALILAAFVSFNVSAQEPANPNSEQTEATAAVNAKADKKDKARKGGRKGQRLDFFRGITLTAEQQSQLDALRPARHERTEGVAKDGKADKADKAKSDRPRRGKAVKGEGRSGGRKNMIAEYVYKVKGILTPEQYVTFLENMLLQPGEHAPHHNGNARHDGDCKRTVCPEKGNCPDMNEK